jgi:hypothetical protein
LSASLMDMMVAKALENIGALLTDPDPYVRLQASLGVLERAQEAAGEFDGPEAPDDRDLNEDGPALAEEEQAMQQLDPDEVVERLAAAAQVQEGRTPPAAERSGRSALGSGQQRA